MFLNGKKWAFCVFILSFTLGACSSTQGYVSTFCYSSATKAVSVGESTVRKMLQEYRIRGDGSPGFGLRYNPSGNQCGDSLGAIVLSLPEADGDHTKTKTVELAKEIFFKYLSHTNFEFYISN